MMAPQGKMKVLLPMLGRTIVPGLGNSKNIHQTGKNEGHIGLFDSHLWQISCTVAGILDSLETSNTVSVRKSSSTPMECPAVYKKQKLEHQQQLWKQSIAKAQQHMVNQTMHQNNLLASQMELMKLLVEDSQSIVED